MKRIRIILAFLKFTIVEKIAFYRNVITNMKNNPHFPEPGATTWADAEASIDRMEHFNTLARGGSHVAVVSMHEVEKATDEMFRLIASYVDRTSNGNASMLLSSGFDITKQPVLYQKPVLRAINGTISGTAMLSALSVPKSGSYIWQIAKGTLPLTDAGWQDLTITTRTTHKVEGLTPAAVYYFRVAAVTPDGIQNFTAAVMLVMR